MNNCRELLQYEYFVGGFCTSPRTSTRLKFFSPRDSLSLQEQTYSGQACGQSFVMTPLGFVDAFLLMLDVSQNPSSSCFSSSLSTQCRNIFPSAARRSTYFSPVPKSFETQLPQ
jgi:hypothetical protein